MFYKEPDPIITPHAEVTPIVLKIESGISDAEDGLVEYQRGNFEEALHSWRPLFRKFGLGARGAGFGLLGLNT